MCRMAVGGIPQRDLIATNGFRNAVKRLVQPHRLRVPAKYYVLESRRRRATPYGLRHTAHAADERLQSRTNLLIPAIDGRRHRAHEIEIGAECIANRCAHWFLFPPITAAPPALTQVRLAPARSGSHHIQSKARADRTAKSHSWRTTSP
jgi:hypothetical protein